MEQELLDYGLSEREVKIYLLLIRTGETTANRLIELSGLPRGTVYDILERLKLRSLISSLVKEKTTYFNANDPDVLVKSLEEKKFNIKRIIPKLKKQRSSIPKKVSIETFEGFAGIKKVLDDVIANTKEVFIMGNEKNAREIIRHHPENFRQKRLDNKIKIKNLLEESTTARELKQDRYSEVRHTSELKGSKEVLIIYNDTTTHMIMEKPFTTIKINSKEYTKTQKLLFNNLWNVAKKFSAKFTNKKTNNK